jgi:hypothetical protein
MPRGAAGLGPILNTAVTDRVFGAISLSSSIHFEPHAGFLSPETGHGAAGMCQTLYKTLDHWVSDRDEYYWSFADFRPGGGEISSYNKPSCFGT